MSTDKIVIKGAREHNLKNVDVTIPRDKLIVMTGLSGSGKSSLAFDTIYADGQRRGNLKAEYTVEGMHMYADGYAAVLDALLPVLKTLR